MIALLQRVDSASVSTRGHKATSIGAGYLIFLGISSGDTTSDIQKLASKILKLRLFADDHQKLNLSIQDVSGQILVVSQFTLLAETKKGNRPSFHLAADKDQAKRLYDHFISTLSLSGLVVKNGVFQADMKVKLVNDGPVTIWLDTKKL